jgi:hypothetical protein
MTRRTMWFAFWMLVCASSVHAQGGLAARVAIRANRRAQQQQQQEAAPQPQGQKLQQQIRRTLWRVAKQRIGFSDEQMARLERTTQRFDQERRLLAVEEKTQRIALRREILADSAANQTAIARPSTRSTRCSSADSIFSPMSRRSSPCS